MPAAAAPSVAAAQAVELTFDDGPDGSGPADGRALVANNQETEQYRASLEGASRRSPIGAGRYGRAALLSGGTDSVSIEGPLAGVLHVLLWVRLTSPSAGWIGVVDGSLGLRWESGAISAHVWDGAWSRVGASAPLAADSSWHHVAVRIELGAATDVHFMVDGVEPPISVRGLVVPGSSAPLALGRGLAGAIDEVWMSSYGAPSDPWPDRFDFDPTDCGDPSMACLEEVFTMTPRGWPWPVPVRIKTIYDPARCTAASPCRLLLDVSGGGKCNDDYPVEEEVLRFARAGYAVAAVDPYCQATASYSQYPHETSQLVEARRFLATTSSLRTRIDADPYYATGGSHGAGAMTYLALREREHPARTFAMSPNASPHCAYHAVMCADQREYADTYWVGFAHDDSDPRARAMHEAVEMPDVIEESIVRSRELGVSWGADTSPGSPVCGADGRTGCYEEGLGFTYGGRRLRDAWRAYEDPAAPSGYFFELRSADCAHGIQGPEADRLMGCVICFFDHGRSAMEARCPECLDLPEGGPAAECPVMFPDAGAPDAGTLDASTLFDAGARDAGAVDGSPPAADAEGGADAGRSAVDAARGGREMLAGCGCRATKGRAGIRPFGLAIALVVLGARRRRAERGHPGSSPRTSARAPRRKARAGGHATRTRPEENTA